MSALFVSLALLLPISSEQVMLNIIDCDDCDLRPLFVIAPYKLEFLGRILNDPTSSSYRICRTYCVIGKAKIDHKLFLPAALRDVAHDNSNIRLRATWFIGVTGSGQETGPLMKLLFDSDADVVSATMHALRKIGDDRTIVALNIWLRSNPELENTPANKSKLQIRQSMIMVRDGIQARLDAAKKAPPVEPTPKK